MSPVVTVEAACAFAKATAHRDAARFGPPVFSFLLGGARMSYRPAALTSRRPHTPNNPNEIGTNVDDSGTAFRN